MKIPRSGARRAALGLLLAGAGCATLAGGRATAISPTPASEYLAWDAATGEFLSIEALAERVRSMDLVLFGELHDDPVAHRIQLELLERLARDSVERTLGLEMFERDVQPALDAYLEGRIVESEFLAGSRPWSNYPSDYRPLVEAARRNGWWVTGTNAPGEIASSIARYGLGTLGSLDLDTRRLVAAELQCPEDEYWLKFLEAMNTGAEVDPTLHAATEPLLRRVYEAQCARDETMAETLAALVWRNSVLHVNGAFHSDFQLGIAPRFARRVPDASVAVISAIPTDDLEDPPLEEHRDRADFLIFTRPDE